METITAETEIETAGFRWLEGDGGVRAIACEPLEREGFANAFSTRGGGVSPFPEASLNLAGFDQDAAENIRENRRRFLSALGGGWKLAASWQVHGERVRVVRDAEDPDLENEHC
ncbi:MAG TPA: laccase domain-containing protein, partial [Pyrinomonadaceae bacterium]